MPKKEPVETNEVEEVKEVVKAPESQAKIRYRELVQDYKEKNPTKYAQKKEEFERRLASDITLKVDKQGKRQVFVFTNLPPKE